MPGSTWLRRRVDLFERRPLHAFSKLTARAGIGLLLPILLGSVIATAVTTASGLAVFAFLALVAIAIAVGSFILPLHGMHNRPEIEKRGHQADCELRIKATIADPHRSVDDRERDPADALNMTLASLLLERDFLARLPTWPWDSSTLRGFITAMLVPLVMWGIIRILERFV